MNYINFDTINSTNDFLKSYSQENNLPDFFYVRANQQTQGKGQRLNYWKSDCCKNILISYFVKHPIEAENQFILNKIVSISIIKFLQNFNIPNLKIKYPNDILSDYYKISGILIENRLRKGIVAESIIGIGLNVNQEKFKDVPFAISMKMLTQKNYDLEKMIPLLTQILKDSFNKKKDEIDHIYSKYLYRPQIFPIKK